MGTRELESQGIVPGEMRAELTTDSANPRHIFRTAHGTADLTGLDLLCHSPGASDRCARIHEPCVRLGSSHFTGEQSPPRRRPQRVPSASPRLPFPRPRVTFRLP